ncbi:MAG: DUF4388 domain-containing protein [Thermodesulfovibrionales bacterium]
MSLVGRLEDLALSDIFQILSVGKKTGTLAVRSARGKSVVTFRDGLVVCAEADVLGTSILDDLLAAQAITDSTYSMAETVKARIPEKSLAEICLELNAVKREHLDRVARKRIEKVVFNLLVWEEGEFQFELENDAVPQGMQLLDRGWSIPRGVSPEYLLMEGARVHDEATQGKFVPDHDILDIQDEEGESWESESPVERKDISALKSLTQELRFPSSTSEITLLILRFASDIFHRGVLFMVGSSEIIGLGQFGLDLDNADEKIRGTVMKVGDSPFFLNLIKKMDSYRGPLPRDRGTERLVAEFGGAWPREVAIFPVVAEKRVVALMLCDNSTSSEALPETDGLEIFINQAGIALEKAILQRRLADAGR